jgi:hypothetical protein
MTNGSNKDLTTRVTALETVVLSVHALGGTSRSVDTEDVAIKANEIAPGMFAWRKYPKQINLELVRVALSDAKKPKYGTLVMGSGREGWRLTSAGLDWVASRGSALETGKAAWDVSRRTAGSIDTVHRDRELARIRTSKAWEQWRGGGQIELSEARWLFRVDSFTSSSQLERKIVRLQALSADDEDLRRFLQSAKNVLRREGGALDE